MGMDVYGRAATSEAGEYFRRNVWGWHPLWDACRFIAPDLTEKVEYGHSNDGDGLDGPDAAELADRIMAAVYAGSVREYVEARQEHLDSLPDEPCEYCGATGFRTDSVGIEYGYDKPDGPGCNACHGKGSNRPFECSYDVDVRDLMEFADFLRASGGFSIC
jgi:hypothetical protein